jgi:hypothetical protein
MHDIDGNLLSIQPDNNRYNGGTHDNPSLTICSVDLKDSTVNYVCEYYKLVFLHSCCKFTTDDFAAGL